MVECISVQNHKHVSLHDHLNKLILKREKLIKKKEIIKDTVSTFDLAALGGRIKAYAECIQYVRVILRSDNITR